MKKERLSSCNVLESTPVRRRLWHFAVERDKPKLERDETIIPPAPLPPKLTDKDWSNLWKPRLNIAWLPVEHVFLRVVQLPAADRAELLSMLEFQLEKLSPLPVAQVLWTVEVMESTAEGQKTAVVCIVSRDVVEEHLGRLESDNYQPDRLELPQLNQIVADGRREDGTWLYPGSQENSNICMVAWWQGGTLQQLQLLRLPELPPETGSEQDVLAIQAAALHEQLVQIAWAGELEGWVTLPVKWRLVADRDLAAKWEPIVSAWSEQAVESAPKKPEAELALFSADRAARGVESADLLPPEFAAKYRQRYIDRLWMGGLGAVVMAYIFGVIAYIIALQVYDFRQTRVQAQVAGLSGTYTNVLQLKEQVQVLQDQFDLKYAALDCFKVASELLPEGFNLTWLMFGRSGTLELHGTAPPGEESRITEFNEAIRAATVEGEPLFRDVTGPNIISRPGAANVTWNFQCFLRVTDQ